MQWGPSHDVRAVCSFIHFQFLSIPFNSFQFLSRPVRLSCYGTSMLRLCHRNSLILVHSRKGGQHLQIYKVFHYAQKRFSGVNKPKIPLLFGLGHAVGSVSAFFCRTVCQKFCSGIFLPQLNGMRHPHGLISEAKDAIHVPKLLLAQPVSFNVLPCFTGLRPLCPLHESESELQRTRRPISAG